MAISSVLFLFKVVTAYGESKLKAPPAINSRYGLLFDENLPTCEKSNALLLNIQQSGIYVNGFLLPVNSHTKTSTRSETDSSLTGRLENQQLSLSGNVPRYILCNISSSQTQANRSQQDKSSSPVRIQIQLADKGDLIGKINVSGTSRTIGLIAIPQKVNEQSKQSNSH
ncbi:hypothetical protein [Mastigocladopsis repens]|uniref:hypothetical protein n=1 Tax=Mastigocladopsis repens TaxID=221287 RepID=UPI000365CECD|nr:hypothetical protein [Mastigocladopsis repens]